MADTDKFLNLTGLQYFWTNKIKPLIGNGYVFMGIASPSGTPPTTITNKIFYLAGPGVYTNFGGINVYKNELAILQYDTSWSKLIIDAATNQSFNDYTSFVNDVLERLYIENSILSATVANGFIDNNETINTSFSTLKHSTYTVQPNTIYKIKSLQFSGENLYVVRYYDSSNHLIERDFFISEDTTYTNKAIITPPNCVKLVINHNEGVCSIVSLSSLDFSGVDKLPQITSIATKAVDIARGSTVTGFINNNGVLNTEFSNLSVDYYTGGNVVSFNFKTNLLGSGFDCVHFFDTNDNYLGHQFPVNGENEYSGTFVVPTGTTKIAINRANETISTSILQKNILYDSTIGELDKRVSALEPNHTIKALFIGNSLNQDNVSYLPWLLKNTYPNLNFEIYICYIGGYTIKQYVENVINGSKLIEIFSVAQNTDVWTNIENYQYANIFANYGPFDLISYQGFGINDGEDPTYFSTFINDLFSRQNSPFKLGYLLPQNYAGTSIWQRLMQHINSALLTTPVDIVFAPGVVTELVKTDFGSSFLTPDSLHNNQGLPCIMGAYEVMEHIAHYIGLPSRVINNQLRITQDIETRLHIPGPNGTLKIGSTEQYHKAQIAAIQACKYIDAYVETQNINILQ